MADRYVRSTDGSNADNGTTWALAKATLAGVDAIDTAGDRLFVSQVHAESTAASVTLNFAGTITSPTKVICGNDGAEPPTAVATTGAMTVTGASNITVNGHVYVYGIIFTVGNAVGGGSFNSGASTVTQRYENCDFIIPSGNTNTASGLFIGSARAILKNCRFKFNNASHGIKPTTGSIHINGGSIISGGTSPTVFIATGSGQILVENFDFSNAAAGINLSVAPTPPNSIIFRNCKLPGSWSGGVLNGSFSSPGRISMYNCDNANTTYKVWIEDQSGTVRDEATIVRTGGASDGTTPLAWKITSGANCAFPDAVMVSDEMRIWNDSLGGSPDMTVTVEYLHDTNVAAGQGSGASSAFQNNEVWLEVNTLESSTTPQGTLHSSAPTTILTAVSDNATGVGTGSWTTTGLTTPKSGKVSVSFTPQKAGLIKCRVCVGKASKTIYVCPKITIS